MALRPRINEFVFNHVGTDTNEYIEVLADPNTDLSTYRLVLIDGDANVRGNIINVQTLGTTNAQGYYVTPYLNNQLQNGTQTLLLVQGYTGGTSGDLDTNDDGILDRTPWASIVDSVAVTDGGAGDLTYAGAPVLPASGGNAVGGASRIPDGTDTDTAADFVTNDFDGAGIPGFAGTPQAGEALNTPGAANALVGGGTGGAGPTAATIRAIQGAAHVSPLAGQSVRTTGIVTAVDRTGSVGFYIQDPTPDANPATSEAVFVFTNTTTGLPAIGDAVTVTGTVTEYAAVAANLSITEINSPTVIINSSGNALPAATVIGQGGRTPPTGVIYNDAPGNLNSGIGDFDPVNEGADFFESLEGMRVTVNNAVVTQGTNGFAETWVLADLGAGSSVRTPRGGILLQQGDDNPERIQLELDPGITTGSFSAVVGDTIQSLTGVLTYDFGNYRIKLTSAPTVTPAATPQEVTSLHGDADTLSFAEWNVENLDPSDPKFDAIAQLIGTNLRTPDILALQEIQDSNGATNDGTTDSTATAAKLIAAVYARTGLVYAYADIAPADGTSGGEPGGNIRPGYLYNPDRVQLTALSSITDSNLADGNAFNASRLPLVGTFRFNGQDVTLIDIHSTSKGGSTSSYGSVQPPVNGGEANRAAQATEIRRVVDARLAIDPTAKIAVLGDANEFAWNAPQQVYTADGVLTDLDDLLPDNERYTYTFDGNSQALDHTLASGGLLDAVSGFDTVHVNSEFTDAQRVSDHDPSVTTVSLARLGTPAPAFVTNIDPAATRTFFARAGTAVTGGSAADIIIGGPGDSSVAGGAGADLFAFLNGRGGGTIVVTDFTAADHIGLYGFGATANADAYAGRSVAGGSTTLTLADNTHVVLSGFTSLNASAFV